MANAGARRGPTFGIKGLTGIRRPTSCSSVIGQAQGGVLATANAGAQGRGKLTFGIKGLPGIRRPASCSSVICSSVIGQAQGGVLATANAGARRGTAFGIKGLTGIRRPAAGSRDAAATTPTPGAGGQRLHVTFGRRSSVQGAMPWDADSPPRGREYRCQKRCRKSSFAFYQAVRDLLPVWMLEEMRTMEVFHWEESGRMSTYSPSEALLYALVHDHQRYGRYLLSQHAQAALAAPSDSFFCCCRSSAPHLAMAVRYNRVTTLRHLLTCVRRCPAIDRSHYVNRRGCAHAERGQTPLHVACELLRPECVTLLLSHGSSPYVTDCEGNTPLDTLLVQLRGGRPQPRTINSCLYTLLLFMPDLTFKMKAALRSDAALWQSLLPPDTVEWLSGRSPPPLFIKAVQSVMAAVPPERFPEGLDELPIAHLLKHLDLRLTVDDTVQSSCK